MIRDAAVSAAAALLVVTVGPPVTVAVHAAYLVTRVAFRSALDQLDGPGLPAVNEPTDAVGEVAA